MSHPALIVIAKAPVPGRVKTRLIGPFTPEQAALLAERALADTLRAVAGASAARRVLVLDGEPGPWLPPGFEVIPQRDGGLANRLAGAFEDVGDPALLVGMDTPQITPGLLSLGSARLWEPGVDAVLGPAPDGGYWAIGLRDPDPSAFEGVPMSSAKTLAVQRERLDQLGLSVRDLPSLRDIDTVTDARIVAEQAPSTRFAAAMRGVSTLPGPPVVAS